MARSEEEVVGLEIWGDMGGYTSSPERGDWRLLLLLYLARWLELKIFS
jgi:hypothetical protein